MVLLICLLGLAAVILLLIMPSLRRHPDRKLFNNGLFTHRGLYDENQGVPENSISAFEKAVAFGYGIEFDIRLTKDSEVIVFHDQSLERMCGLDKKVSELTLSEIKELCLGNTEEKIPTLKEMLMLVDGRVPIIIEYKLDDLKPEKLCEKSNKILADYTGIYAVESFNPMVLLWFKEHKPAVMRGQLAVVYKGKNIFKKCVSIFLLNFITKPDFVAFAEKEKNRLSFKIQKLLGAFSIGWTIKSNERLKECKDDFNAYIFEGFKPEI